MNVYKPVQSLLADSRALAKEQGFCAKGISNFLSRWNRTALTRADADSKISLMPSEMTFALRYGYCRPRVLMGGDFSRRRDFVLEKVRNCFPLSE